VKIALVFCINLLLLNSVYAELSRKDLVSYTLDFYTDKTEEKDTKVKKQLEETVRQGERISSPGYFSKSYKLIQVENKQKKVNKAISMEEIKAKKAIRKKSKAEKREALLKSRENEKGYGTKLSFSKASDKLKEKDTFVSKKNELKKDTKSTGAIEKKPNYIKGILKNTHPFIIGKGEFNDNIYHVKGNETYDYITQLYPGFEFKTKTNSKNFDVYLNTGANVLTYAKNSQHNTASPFAKGFLRYNFGNLGFITSAYSRRLRGTPSDLADEEIKEFIDSWQYDMSQDFKINFNRFDVNFQYNKSLYSYEDEEFKLSNHAKDVIALRSSIKILPKTKLFAEYAHGWLNYDKNTESNYDYDRPILGLNGKIFRKLEGTIKVGYNFNRRKTLKDLNGTVFSALLTYKASPRLHYNLDVMNGLGSLNLITEGVTKYKGASVGISYLPPFLKKLRVKSKVGYWQRGSDYQTKDNYWEVSFKPEYKLKDWLMFGIGYTFQNRDSKAQFNDYRNNRIELSMFSEF
jgi:hypothetical protein